MPRPPAATAGHPHRKATSLNRWTHPAPPQGLPAPCRLAWSAPARPCQGRLRRRCAGAARPC